MNLDKTQRNRRFKYVVSKVSHVTSFLLWTKWKRVQVMKVWWARSKQNQDRIQRAQEIRIIRKIQQVNGDLLFILFWNRQGRFQNKMNRRSPICFLYFRRIYNTSSSISFYSYHFETKSSHYLREAWRHHQSYLSVSLSFFVLTKKSGIENREDGYWHMEKIETNSK